MTGLSTLHHLSNRLLAVWTKITNIGVTDQTPAKEIKFIRFTNIVAGLTVLAVGAYIPHSLINGSYLIAGLQFIDTLFVLSVFWFNHKGYYNIAKFAYLFVINTFVVLNACIIGSKSGVQEFLFISNVTPFLLFRVNDYKRILLGMAMAMTAYMMHPILVPFFLDYNLPDALQYNVSQINVVMKFILFGMAMYIMAAYNLKGETEIETINHQLTLHTQELNRSNKDLEHFAYIISHDLKAPIRNISHMLDIYTSRFHREENGGKDFLLHSKQSADRMVLLIEDLLNYSKVGKNLPNPEPTDLNQLMRTLEMELAQRIAETNAELIVEQPLPVLTKVHSTMIYHVFQNLITNGIKFNKSEKPRVIIQYTPATTHHLFSVTDNGIGIPEELSKGLFQMFRRLHTTEFEGSGMGLAICKKIIENYGGQIAIESQPGNGSRFNFTLPV